MDSPAQCSVMSLEDFSAVHFGEVLKKRRDKKCFSQEGLSGNCYLNLPILVYWKGI